ncbi:MAG: Ig-like domain-containing protein [Candidatus Hatepunaea meridiana]|nr:Ig-like domain-containing protein [Candidatus Hatepunaea meridiana]
MKIKLPLFLMTLLTILFVISCEDDEAPTAPVIDHLAPLVEWIAPVNGDDLSGVIDIVFTASDEGGIERTQVYLNGFPPDDFQTSASDDTLYTLEWNTRDYDDDVYILEARAWDEAGNLGISPSLLVNVKNETDPPPEDRIPPYVWWIAPEPGSTLSDTANLQIGFYDENVVDSVSLLKNGVLVSTIAASGESLDYLWDTRTDSDGVYIWEAHVWDEAGNMGVSPSLLLRVKNNLDPPPDDRTPPMVVWLSPEPGSEVSGEVELSFQVMDDVGLDSVNVYLNGQELHKLTDIEEFSEVNIIWITSDYTDGNYIIEVRAWDSSGNIGIGVGVVLTVRNNVPRVIWVPDDYRTIQDAINASEDGDTVRVKPGTYYEMIYFWDKNVWLESEKGPETTIIDVRDHTWGLKFEGGQDTTAGVRGFTIQNSPFLAIYCATVSSPKIVNNIFYNSGQSALRNFINRSVIRNNIFSTSRQGAELNISFGEFDNNIVIHCERFAVWNSYFDENPIVPDFNLIWDYNERTNDPPIRFGVHNIFDIQPRFVLGSYVLSDDSPCIDSGRPDLRDLEGSRSDIGVYGGPYAYPIR